MTSCEFAANVRYAWFHQPGRVIEAYSPVTGMYYTMYCDPNYTARMASHTKATTTTAAATIPPDCSSATTTPPTRPATTSRGYASTGSLPE